MEIALMRLELREGHAFQRQRIVSGIRDNGIVTRISRLRGGHKRRHGREQGMIDIYRVIGDVEVPDRRAAKARFERERIRATGAENRHVVADVAKRVVS